MSASIVLRDAKAELTDALALARGPARLEAAARVVRTARLALESATGDDVAAIRELLRAIEAAHVEVGP